MVISGWRCRYAHNSYNKCSSEQDFCVSGVIAVVCRSSLLSAAIDILMDVDFSGRVFYGGVLIAAGILVNTILEKKFSNGTAELEHGSTTDKELISDCVGNSASAETKE